MTELNSSAATNTGSNQFRRNFLQRVLSGAGMAVALAVPSSSAFAFQKGPKGQGGGQKGKGPGAQGKGGPGQGKGGPPDAKTIASRMIQEFDRDGDGALNQLELAAALTAMRQRRMQGQGGPGKAGAGGKGKPGAGKGNGKPGPGGKAAGIQ